MGWFYSIKQKSSKQTEPMKAFVRTDAQNLEVKLEEVPIPEVYSDEVLIKVEAFGVGIHDRFFIPMAVRFPYTIGVEGSGIITKLGNGVKGYAIGDRVIFTTVLQPQGGCWAEFAVARVNTLILLPEKLSFAQGAAFSIAAKTALESMRSLRLEKSDTLFIAGASGAIGTLVIQLAAKKGIRVSGSASEKNHEYMKSLGLEKAVDYNDPNWQNEIIKWSNGGVNAVLAIQPGTGIDGIKVVKDGGRLITVSGDNEFVTEEREIVIDQMNHHDDMYPRISELLNSISKGEIKIVIEKEYPFEQALQALEKTETKHARGKQVVLGFMG